MFFSPMTYPVEQPYRIPWITELFYAGSAVLIALLVIFNSILEGYETVTFLSKDPNATYYKQWWAPEQLPDALKFRTKPGECQSFNLPSDTPIRTNSSLPVFSYFVLDSFVDRNILDKDGLATTTPYQAHPLDDCSVGNMEFIFEPKFPAFKISTTVVCPPNGNPPRERKFRVAYSGTEDSRFRPDSIIDYLAYNPHKSTGSNEPSSRISNDGPPNDTFLNVLGVLDGLSSDLGHALTMQWKITNDLDVPDVGYITWNSRADGRPLSDESRLGRYGSLANGYSGDKNDYIKNLRRTIINVIIAVRAAIYLDLGSKDDLTNIYFDKPAFNNVILPNPYIPNLVSILRSEPHNSNEDPVCSWAWGCLSSPNDSWARALTSTDQPVNNLTLPVVPKSPVGASILEITYTCPKYEQKSWGNLLTSVFIGTFTMYTAICGIFCRLAPEFDRRFHGAHAGEYTQIQEERQHSGNHDSFKGPHASPVPETPTSVAWHEDNNKESLLPSYSDRKL